MEDGAPLWDIQMLSGAGVKGWWGGEMPLKVAANAVVTQRCYSLLVLT